MDCHLPDFEITKIRPTVVGILISAWIVTLTALSLFSLATDVQAGMSENKSHIIYNAGPSSDEKNLRRIQEQDKEERCWRLLDNLIIEAIPLEPLRKPPLPKEQPPQR